MNCLIYIPFCIVDLWDQTDVCHGYLRGKQSNELNKKSVPYISLSPHASYLITYAVFPRCLLQNGLESWNENKDTFKSYHKGRGGMKAHRSYAHLGSRAQWSAEPTAPFPLQFSGARVNSETSAIWHREVMCNTFFFLLQLCHICSLFCCSNCLRSLWHARDVLPAEAVSQRQWGHLSSEPGRDPLGPRGGGEAPAWSHRRTGSQPAAWVRNHFYYLYKYVNWGMV